MIDRRGFCTGLLALTLPSAPAFADDVVDFSGTWALDKRASDSIDDILKAQGVSWFKRKAVGGLSVTQRVVQKGTLLDVVIESSVKTQAHQWVVDGEPHTRTLDDGREATSTHRFEGGALVTTTTGLSVGGDAYTLVSRRSLADEGQTTRLDLACTIDGSTTKATRVFRREES